MTTAQRDNEERRSQAADRRRDERDTRISVAFYFSLMFLAGQFVARVVLEISFNYLLLGITGAAFLGILFGPTFVIDFFRALRGSGRDGGGTDA